MKTTFLIAVFLFWVIFLFVFEHQGQPKPAQTEPEKVVNAENPRSATRSPTENEGATERDCDARNGAERGSQRQEVTITDAPDTKWIVDLGTLIFTGILAFASVVGTTVAGYAAYVALKTLREISREAGAAVEALKHSAALADAAKTTADTAKSIAEATVTSANAIMNSGRAWVIASPQPQDANSGGAGNQHLNRFICAITSAGSTPARLIDAAVVYWRIESLQSIPADPEYGERGPLNDLPLVQRDSFGVVALLAPTLSAQDIHAVRQGQQFLYAYGVVTYKDVFDNQHETRFGYVYHIPQGGDPRPEGFRREGLPTAYNRAT